MRQRQVDIAREHRWYWLRARLVALAEEVMMASSPKPTETQLRQHALDRALTDAVVNRVAQGIGDDMYDPNPGELADGILNVAKKFTEYLSVDPDVVEG